MPKNNLAARQKAYDNLMAGKTADGRAKRNGGAVAKYPGGFHRPGSTKK